MDAGFSVTGDLAQRAEAEMAAIFADWIVARGLGGGLSSPQAMAQLILSALKGMKSDATDLEDYRTREALLADVLARALQPGA
jgi:hypothetical protein